MPPTPMDLTTPNVDLPTLTDLLERRVLAIAPETPLAEVLDQLTAAQNQGGTLYCAIAVDPQGRPQGLWTEREILPWLMQQKPLAGYSLHTVMTPQPTVFQLQDSTSIGVVWEQMQQQQIQYLPVVDNQGKLQGVITRDRLLQALNSTHLHHTVQALNQKIAHLESEKQTLLAQQTTELEEQVAARTQALQTQIRRSEAVSRRERLLSKIANNLRQSLNLDEILHATVQDVRSFFDVDRVAILQFDADWQGRFVAESASKDCRSVLGEVVYDPCFEPDWVDPYLNGRIRAVEDITAVEMADCHRELLEGIQIRAKVLVPIVISHPDAVGEHADGRRLWGLLNVHQCTATRSWQPFELQLLERLANQVAIAIEQSELYQRSQAELAQRQRMEMAFRNLVVGTAAITGADFFPALAQHLASALEMRLAIVTHWVDEQFQILGYCQDDQYPTPSVDSLHDLLHEQLACTVNPLHCYPTDFAQTHPTFVQSCSFIPVSYCGITLLSADQTAIGTLCVVDDQPIEDVEQTEAILQVFAARAAAELDRQWVTKRLQHLNQTLESWVIKRTDDLQQSLKELSDIKYALDQFAIIAITDLDGVITDVNDKFCEISEYSRTELMGQTHRLIHSEYHLPDFFQALWQTIKQGQIWRGEIKNRSKSGRLYWVDTSIVPLLDEKQKPYQYLAIRIDITEQKRAEEATIQLLKKEQELSELKSRFVSMASHEFRTPLALISSSAGILQDYSDRLSIDKKAKHLDRIQGAVQQMTQLLEDVLTVNRAAADQLPFNPVIIDVTQFCQDVREEFHQNYPQRYIQFQVISPTQSTPDDSRLSSTLWADPKLLRQILSNLLSNALKYSPEEEPIEWCVESTVNHWVFVIRDRGIGIPEADQSRLFESFHRAQNVGTIQGTGLGLAIVKECVDLHCGSITIESTETVGTTVIVQLPHHPGETAES